MSQNLQISTSLLSSNDVLVVTPTKIKVHEVPPAPRRRANRRIFPMGDVTDAPANPLARSLLPYMNVEAEMRTPPRRMKSANC